MSIILYHFLSCIGLCPFNIKFSACLFSGKSHIFKQYFVPSIGFSSPETQATIMLDFYWLSYLLYSLQFVFYWLFFSAFFMIIWNLSYMLLMLFQIYLFICFTYEFDFSICFLSFAISFVSSLWSVFFILPNSCAY